MPSIKNMPCWEIMNCNGSENCPAKQNTQHSCWELVRELGDYRAEFDICPDCIVYVVKNTDIVLSAHEINQIRLKGNGSCLLARESC